MLRSILKCALFISSTAFWQTSVAGIITWEAAQDITGQASDISTEGTFFDSAAALNTTVNGVIFNGSLSGGTYETFQNSAIRYSYSGRRPSHGVAPSEWGSEYQKLLNPHGYSTGGQILIFINNLKIGEDYLVQIFAPYWNTTWTTEYLAGNTS